VDAQGIAVVTGASRGFGRAIALALADAGFDVIATMRDPAAGAGLPDELSARSSGSITVAALDVTKPPTIQLPDGLRVLVNNAAIEATYLPVEAIPMEDWRSVFETNLFGLIEVTRRAIPLMRATGGGVICNVTSASLAMSVPFYGLYRASKAAVQTMGESLRAEVGPFGIRVLEVMPGPVDTDMLANSARRLEAADCPGYEAMAESIAEGRSGVDPFITPAATAAAAVLEAILADDGPLRFSCDQLGRLLLAGWQEDPEKSLNAR
jgi:NAD(P)-dependent dehydrogenase (short-subunit alcohol dehydrogenase family)